MATPLLPASTIPPAEALVLATGVLEPPTATHVRAAGTIGRQLRAIIRETVKTEKQGRLYVVNQPDNVYDQLVALQPDYEAFTVFLEGRAGLAVAAGYQVLHAHVVDQLKAVHPSITIDTILGPQSVGLDDESQAEYLLEVDTCTNYLRFVRDFAAGGILAEQVTLFSALFPGTYQFVSDTVRQALADRYANERDWLPEFWLEDSVRTLLQLPDDGAVTVTPGKAPQPLEVPAKKLANAIKLPINATRTLSSIEAK